jgi:cytochrome c-type biogenesis protein CcmE
LDRRRAKFLILGAGIALSMAALVVFAVNRPGGLVYYLGVSEFLAEPAAAEAGFRVNGKVESGTIVRMPTGQDVTFVMTDGRSALPVAYHGIVPDTFVDGADVVVEGRLGTDGTFQAHTLLAKCPSKYEAADEEPRAAAALEASRGE